MIASFVLMAFDFIARNLRTFFLHLGYKNGSGLGFHSVPAKMEILKDSTGTIIRMTFTHEQPWQVGQHFYLTFPALNMWQSHPFTPASLPNPSSSLQTHTYIIRACNGETKRLAELAEAAMNRYPRGDDTTPVIIQGPYGGSILNNDVSNILAVTGGTGVTYALPVVKAALAANSPVRNVELVWTVRHRENLAWIAPELAYLKSQLDQTRIHSNLDKDMLDKDPAVPDDAKKRFRIRIFVTRGPSRPPRPDSKELDFGFDKEIAPVSSIESEFESELEELARMVPGFSITYLNNGRPDIGGLVDAFMEGTVEQGRTQVVGSGPPQLGTRIRAAVAAWNSPGMVWRGDERGDVECVWDDRMG